MAKTSGGTRSSRLIAEGRGRIPSSIFSDNDRLSNFVEKEGEVKLRKGYVLKSTPVVEKINDKNVRGLQLARYYKVELYKGNKTVAWSTAEVGGKSMLIDGIKTWKDRFKL